jgi:hypothetical protein
MPAVDAAAAAGARAPALPRYGGCTAGGRGGCRWWHLGHRHARTVISRLFYHNELSATPARLLVCGVPRYAPEQRFSRAPPSRGGPLPGGYVTITLQLIAMATVRTVTLLKVAKELRSVRNERQRPAFDHGGTRRSSTMVFEVHCGDEPPRRRSPGQRRRRRIRTAPVQERRNEPFHPPRGAARTSRPGDLLRGATVRRPLSEPQHYARNMGSARARHVDLIRSREIPA